MIAPGSQNRQRAAPTISAACFSSWADSLHNTFVRNQNLGCSLLARKYRMIRGFCENYSGYKAIPTFLHHNSVFHTIHPSFYIAIFRWLVPFQFDRNLHICSHMGYLRVRNKSIRINCFFFRIDIRDNNRGFYVFRIWYKERYHCKHQ